MHRPPLQPRNDAGFTLVELLVVAVALGVLAVFASSLLSGDAAALADTPTEPEPAPAAPASPSPAAELVRRAGAAVLLFGGGFRYLAELRRPGCLDDFRLGHFLLLALTYSLFFVAFAVLHEQQLSPWLAVGVAAALSYPLVALHVATVVDARFAWTAALPLAALTTGIVVNGAYGGDVRALVYLGMLALVVAFLTLSYPRLTRGIERHHRAHAERVAEAVAALTAPVERLRGAHAAALVLLRREDVDEHRGLRGWLEQRARGAEDALQSFEHVRRLHEAAATETSRGRRRALAVEAGRLVAGLPQRLAQVAAALTEAADNLQAQRERADGERRAAADEPDDAHEHCVACGHRSARGARFCASCGQKASERRECRRCARVLHLPRHLLRAPDAGKAVVTFCLACGEQHAAAG